MITFNGSTWAYESDKNDEKLDINMSEGDIVNIEYLVSEKKVKFTNETKNKEIVI